MYVSETFRAARVLEGRDADAARGESEYSRSSFTETAERLVAAEREELHAL